LTPYSHSGQKGGLDFRKKLEIAGPNNSKEKPGAANVAL